MGCSPSKGKLFSKPEASPKASPAATIQDGPNCRPAEIENTCLKTELKENELPLPTEEYCTKETAFFQSATETKDASNAQDVKETEMNLVPDEMITNVQQTKGIKSAGKRKKNKGKKRSTERQRKSCNVQTKVDFPLHMVRAHQAAYNFLIPNISKYETLLGLLDQAAQTQLSLQPMMSALVLRFEEINQALEEVADEGELMLKEHFDYMALPSGMMGPAKPRNGTAYPTDPPPDLLQQLLQQSAEKMKLVGDSVQALSDTMLEEAVEYFSSLDKLLVKKLQAKQAAERRLAHVLARVEGAATRRSNPEDSALHSEDSGIGGENESLTGSERHRRHRGSAGSGSCGSGVNIRSTFDSLPSNLSNLTGHNEDAEEDDDDDDCDDDDDDDDDEEDESETPGRKRSNSSPPDPSQAFRYMPANDIQAQQPTVKRPLSASISTKPEHFSFTRCGNIMTELQNSQWALDQKMKKMAEIRGNKESAGPCYKSYRAGLRRHSLNGSAGAHKGPLKTNQPPCSLPVLEPQPPRRSSVRRLIHTFSQGVDGRPGQSLGNIPPHIRRPRKSGILLLSDTVNGKDESLVINGNNNNNSWPESRDELDVDNLPPPPPEVLLDNSFQSTQVLPGAEEESQEDSVSPPVINQKSGISHRLKTSIHNVEVLPNRACIGPRSIAVSAARPVRQDAVMGAQDADQQRQTDLDPDTEKANNLYQQARKIIHLRDAAESSDKRNIAEPGDRANSPFHATIGERCESSQFYEGEMSSCTLPVIAPPVSRVRLPPSCPTVCKRFPSPPVFRPQSTSRPSSRPGSPRTVARATENKTEEIIPSVSFRDARSVFCQNDLQSSQACPSFGSSVLPRRWGEASRGRLPTRGTDGSTRRTQSDHRPSATLHSQLSKEGSLASLQAKGSEPNVTKYGPGSPLMAGDHQLDPSVHVRTAVVGQGF